MSRKLTIETIREIMEKEGYKLLSREYTNAREPLEVVCNKGHEPYKVRWYNFKSGRRCPTCDADEISKRKATPIEHIKEMVSDANYTLIKAYPIKRGDRRIIKVGCDKGHDPYKVTISNFRRGRRCPECKADKSRKPIEDIRDEMSKQGFKLLSTEYINNRKPIDVECPRGHKYLSTYGLFHSGKRCPICNFSKRERLIKNILDGYGVAYTHQHPEKIGGTIHYYDFCIHGEEDIWIEYDGIQHFKPVERFGGGEGLKETQRRDRLKNKHAELKDIKLIRIPYTKTDEEIKTIIEDIISQYYRNITVL